MTYQMKVYLRGSNFAVTTTFPPGDSEDYVMMRAEEEAEQDDCLYVEVLEDGVAIERIRGEAANTKGS